MSRTTVEVVICLVLLTTTVFLLFINKSLISLEFLRDLDPEYTWIAHGLQNILGYSTVLLPGYIVHKILRRVNYLDDSRSNCIAVILRKCFDENPLIDYINPNTSKQETYYALQDAWHLLFYFIGLQVSFLTWGILQEKIMTQRYINMQGLNGYFTDSQFLVFINRILAFCISGMVVVCTRQPRHKSPLYKYSFCSLSNILSSWYQYEALKYVSFPHQVLAKAAKVIPVMLVGKIVSKTKYEYYEYVTAVLLSIGMLFFMLDTENHYKSSAATTISGIILLCSYIIFDSFTSNWQGALFKQYSMTPVQMMCAVNLFSCIFTAVSLMQQGGFVLSINFMYNFPQFIADCMLLSICSAAGQLFIFKTISTFGPIVFAIITTIRQGLSVLLSCIIYKHHIPPIGAAGITLVFFSILLRIYCGYRIKMLRKHAQNVNKV